MSDPSDSEELPRRNIMSPSRRVIEQMEVEEPSASVPKSQIVTTDLYGIAHGDILSSLSKRKFTSVQNYLIKRS